MECAFPDLNTHQPAGVSAIAAPRGRRLAIAAIVAVANLAAGCGDPTVETNPAFVAPIVTMGPSGPLVHNSGAPEHWKVLDGIPPRPFFLFSGVLASARDERGDQGVLAPAGDRLLVFDANGRFIRTEGDGELRRAIAVTRHAGRWLVVERDGRVTHLGTDTTAIDIRAPFMSAVITSFDSGFVGARSAFALTIAPEKPAAPLLVALSAVGTIVAGIDTVRRPAHTAVVTIANAGHLAASDSSVFFAFLTRDELRAYDRQGHLRWTADREMSWPRPPTLPTGTGPAGLRYQSVNLAVTSARGLVYVLSYADSTAEVMRVDAFDERTGVLSRSTNLPSATMLLSLDSDGGLWRAPADTLDIIGSLPAAPVVSFRLPTPAGDTLDSRSLLGKVVLLNVWASWCDPCRDEFPLMTALAREFAGDLEVVAVNEDRDESGARRFLGELKPSFPIAWGRGALQPTLRYRGLPFTALLDRDGRIVRRYFGFGGSAQFDALRADIQAVVGR